MSKLHRVWGVMAPGLSVASLFALALLATGCSCGGPNAATLTIVQPVTGTVFTLESDLDPDMAGVQILVEVATEGLDGEEVQLEGGAEGPAVALAAGGMVAYQITLTNESSDLVASARSGAISDRVSVFLEDGGGCPTVGYVTPEAPAGGTLTLGPTDDTDGEACGETFESEVAVSTNAPDGTEARIFVNDTPARTATAANGVVRFEGVGLNIGVRNQISVRVGNDMACEPVPFDAVIELDCEGVACSITEPTSTSGYLNQSDDVSTEEGFQGDFVVMTDEDGAGNEIQLIIDGNESEALSTTPAGMSVTFGSVALTEGAHRVQAVCRDGVGNVTRSAVSEYTVDITPCEVGVDAPTEGQLFVEEDDVNDEPSSVEIIASGTAGADCTALRVDLCSGIDGVEFGDSETSWSSEVSLATTAMQEICAQTEDEAGNVAEARVAIRFNTTAPQLEIASPADGAAFNIAGDSTHTADLVSGNDTCEVAFDVLCTGVDDDVELVRESNDAVLATATCVADAGAPAPYAGRATFAMASLPTFDDGSALRVVARQTSDRLTGESAPISVTSDCVAPPVVITQPMCGAIIRPATQDEDTGTPGLQYTTRVANPSGADIDLVLQVSGGAVTDTLSNTTGATVVTFDAANYGAGGLIDVLVTATDPAGNTTTPECQVTVADLPTVEITAPTAGALLTDFGGCSATEIEVTGTTDAADGSTVTVSVDGTETTGTVTSGAFSVCATAAEGRDLTVQVSITDGRGTGTASVTVTLDTQAPPSATTPSAFTVVDRRGGVLNVEWSGVEDAGGFALSSYELRCAATEITTEAEWDAATAYPLTTTPTVGSPTHAEDVSVFRVGTQTECVLRGADPAGRLTPIGESFTAANPFAVHTVVPDGASAVQLLGFGNQVTGVGDVNGDGVDDAIVSGNNGAALFFGSAAGFSASPAVVIDDADASLAFSCSTTTGTACEADGDCPDGETCDFNNPQADFVGVGLGDFNGDTIPDFAVVRRDLVTAFGDPVAGSFYVFFGRDSATPWPSRCTIGSATGCGPDLTFEGTETFSGFANFFGAQIAPAGLFDGDALADIVVGVFNNDSGGAGFDADASDIYVILGSADYTGAYQIPGGTLPNVVRITPPAGTNSLKFGGIVGTAGGSVSGTDNHDILVQSNRLNATDERVWLIEGASVSGTGLIAYPGTPSVLDSSASGNNLGRLLGPAGDLDNDGSLDVLVCSTEDNSRGGVGRYLNDGTSGPVAPPVALSNPIGVGGPDELFGASVGLGRHPTLGNVGDIDRDGFADLFIGSEGDADGSGGGTAYLFYGSATITAGDPTDADASFEGTTGPRVVGNVGDIDGDMYPDLAVGDPGENGGTGRLLILY